MLHAIVGNGSINPRELIATIDSLWEAAEARDENFWVEWVVTPNTKMDPLEALSVWADESGLALVLVADEKDLVDHYLGAQTEITDDPYGRERTIIAQQGGKVLALIPEDVDELAPDAVDFITSSIKRGVTVHDLSHQMVEIKLESDEPSVPEVKEEAPAAVEEPEPEPVEEEGPQALVDPPSHSLTEEPSIEAIVSDLSAEDFDSHTLEELRIQCTELGLEPIGDKRRKDSYVEALLVHYRSGYEPKVQVVEVTEVVEPVQEVSPQRHQSVPEVSTAPAATFEVAYLTVVSSDGTQRAYAVDATKAKEILGLG